MRYGGLYGIILLLHLLTAVFVIGPLAIAGVAAPRALDDGEPAVQRLQDGHRLVQRYALASILVPLLGTAMVGLGNDPATDVGARWAFNQFWVSSSYALYLVAVLALLLVAAPSIKKAATALEAGESTEVYKGRMQAAAGGAALAFVVIIVLMVFKPGA